MPVSRLTSEGLATELADMYAAAEVRLLREIARHLEAGLDAPGWQQDKLAELQLFRRRAAKLMAQVTAQAQAAAAQATATGYLLGAAAGEGDLLAAGIDLAGVAPQQAERAVEALVRAHAGQLEDVGLHVVRQSADAYRDAVTRASVGTLSGAATRRQDAQAALDDLARRGLTGFTDSKGRQWGLESYVDMATRTTTAQAAVAGSLDRLAQGGIELVLVSTSSRECERCRPWEGKVLSRGPVDVLQTNVLTGELERVDVDGTVQEATRAGLFHPNCTHNLSGYIHGATKRGDAQSNPKGYAEKQEQRRLERRLREWKRRQAVAVTDEAKRKAKAKVDDYARAIRDHVASTGLPRKPHRENLDVRGPRIPGDRPAGGKLRDLDVDVIDAEMRELMERGDYGPRFEQLAAELDRRDNEGGHVQQTLPDKPDADAERAALHQLLFGDHEVRDLSGPRKVKTAKELEAELRDEYRTWVHSQWLRAEEDTRGHMLTKRAQRDGVDVVRLFTRELRNLDLYATEELKRWFAEPGNTRLSFPEWRSENGPKSKGYESEYG